METKKFFLRLESLRSSTTRFSVTFHTVIASYFADTNVSGCAFTRKTQEFTRVCLDMKRIGAASLITRYQGKPQLSTIVEGCCKETFERHKLQLSVHAASHRSIKRHTPCVNSDYYEAARSYGCRLIISPVLTLLLSLLL